MSDTPLVKKLRSHQWPHSDGAHPDCTDKPERLLFDILARANFALTVNEMDALTVVLGNREERFR
jgi:hypothetical protein